MSEFIPNAEYLKELLVGRSIVSAEILDEAPDRYSSGPIGVLALSDGVKLKVWGNEGGCSCGAGDYPLDHLVGVEGVVTNVEVEERPDPEYEECSVCGKENCYDSDHRGFYRVFVVTEAQGRSMLASFEGSDGNGYYGTGWWLEVMGE